jgi:hypothetical protein
MPNTGTYKEKKENITSIAGIWANAMILLAELKDQRPHFFGLD